MKIDEITSAEEQLEIIKMIFANTWSAFAQKAEKERQAQSKKRALRATTKRGRVKTARPAPAPARRPDPPLQAQTQPRTTAQMNVDAKAQHTMVPAPIKPVPPDTTGTKLTRQNGGLGGALRAKPLINSTSTRARD